MCMVLASVASLNVADHQCYGKRSVFACILPDGAERQWRHRDTSLNHLLALWSIIPVNLTLRVSK